MSRARPPARRLPRSAQVVAILAAVLALTVGAAGRSEPPAVDAVVVDADGDLDLRNSKDGMPILSASGLAPGDTASGQVTVTNAGTGGGQFSLKRQALSDTPGPGGGSLSNRLQLVVRDVTVPAAPTTVYSGALGSMPEKGLGTLGAGQVRVYRLEASLPEGGTGDNAYQGSAASVGYKWTVTNGGTPPADPPGNPPTPPAGGKPSTGGKPGTGGGPAATPGLKVTIAMAKSQRMKRKTLAVRVLCTQQCSVSARGVITVKGVKKALGQTAAARKAGKPDRWVTLNLKLPKKVLPKVQWALANRKKMTVKVTVSAKTATGLTAKAVESGGIR